MASLELRAISFSYGDRLILNRISLSLNTGETVVLAGGNGCGKSTLLRIAAGLRQPSEGIITISPPEHSLHKSIGIVFQNPDAQMIATTVEEELALGLELRGLHRLYMRSRVEEIIKRFHLEELRYRSPESLSGGQKQRVAVASVMASDPLFLLLDEPDSLLDARGRREFNEALSLISDRTGILRAVSDPHSMPTADRCYLLRDGDLSETVSSTGGVG